jgi:predicted nucleotidyltransferase
MSSKELNEALKNLAEKYARLARENLGTNIISVTLFGSVARGEATPNSDIDLLIVCEEFA